MVETSKSTLPLNQRLAVNTSELAKMLGCGRMTASNIGIEAGAKVKVGKRVLWNVKKIRALIDGNEEK